MAPFSFLNKNVKTFLRIGYQVHLRTGCYFPFPGLYTDSVTQLWNADFQCLPSWPVRCQRSHLHLFYCHCLHSRMLTLLQPPILPPQVSICPTTHPVFLFTVVSHTASLFPKCPQLNSYGLLGSGPLRLSVRHQSQGSEGEHLCHFKKCLWRKETD